MAEPPPVADAKRLAVLANRRTWHVECGDALAVLTWRGP